jgi:EAL domain-containing protein (putative c-di-GMP-specific phosphodiesterase class I)
MIVIENETSNNELMELERILRKEEILTVFQPIVELKNGNIIGYEGLSRGPVNSPLYTPDKLFKVAEENHMLWDLELLCSVKAIERARNIDIAGICKNLRYYSDVEEISKDIAHIKRRVKSIKGSSFLIRS